MARSCYLDVEKRKELCERHYFGGISIANIVKLYDISTTTVIRYLRWYRKEFNYNKSIKERHALFTKKTQNVKGNLNA